MKTSGIKRYRNPSQRLDKWGYLFIAPFVLVFLVFSLYPMIYSIILSFTNENLTSSGAFENFTSIDNYRWIFSQRQFWQSFLNTLIIFIMNFIPQIVSALFFAVLFSSKRIRMKGKGFFQFVYFLPNILTATSVAALFLFLFGYIQTIDGTPREVLFTNSFYGLAWMIRFVYSTKCGQQELSLHLFNFGCGLVIL